MKRIKYLKTYLITGAIFLVVGVAIFLIFFLLKHGLIGAIDGTAFAGIILVGVSLLMLIARLGLFDGFAFGFKQLSYKFKKDLNELPNYPDYLESKNAKRKDSPRFYIPVLIVGVLFLIALAILEIIYAANFA